MNQATILYGVQGTGNGHISRARLMASEFARLDVPVDYLFSGRAQAAYFDMEEFANRRFETGLSFKTHRGRIRKLQTLKNSKLLSCAREITALRTDRYKLVISDFEPTSAWAARLRGTPTLALGHQYALTQRAPMPQGDLFAKWIARHFTPANQRIGFHWHPYDSLTLPPMIDTTLTPISNSQSFTLVYLPFEELQETLTLLQQLRSEHFVVYSPDVSRETQSRNVSIYPLSKNGFRHHLQRCTRVICNTGFELIAESLHLGKPVLTKPLAGQFEQVANAMALKELQLASITPQISVLGLDKFLASTETRSRIIYPNVARELAEFCLQQADGTLAAEESHEALASLAQRLWSQLDQSASTESQAVGQAPALAAA